MSFPQDGQENQQNKNRREDWENPREKWEQWEEQQRKKDWDRWDSNASHSSYYNQPTHPPYDQGFSIAAMILGLLSVTLGCCGFSIPLGALGIIFAVLCRRDGKKPDSNCQAGFAMSVIGILIGIFTYVLIIVRMVNDPAFMEQLNQISRLIYGMDFSELIKNLLRLPVNN